MWICPSICNPNDAESGHVFHGTHDRFDIWNTKQEWSNEGWQQFPKGSQDAPKLPKTFPKFLVRLVLGKLKLKLKVASLVATLVSLMVWKGRQAIRSIRN